MDSILFWKYLKNNLEHNFSPLNLITLFEVFEVVRELICKFYKYSIKNEFPQNRMLLIFFAGISIAY